MAGVLTGTASVERWLNQVALQEMKKRANQLHIYNLERAVKLNVQSSTGHRTGCQFNPDSLLDGKPQEVKASRFRLAAAALYREWYGEKDAPARRGGPGDLSRPALGNVRTAERSSTSMKAVLQNHSKSVDLAVAACGSSEAKKDIVGAMVETIRDVESSRRRRVRGEASTETKRKREEGPGAWVGGCSRQTVQDCRGCCSAGTGQ